MHKNAKGGNARGLSRGWRIVLWVAGALVLIVGGGLAALRLSSPPVSEFRAMSEKKELPQDWLEPPRSQEAKSPETVQTSAEIAASSPTSAISSRQARATSGTLLFVGGERPFGEESYELTLDDEGAVLTSFGRFWFKALVATINVTFEQRLEADGTLRPTTYDLAFAGPLGFDRAVHTEIVGDEAITTSGDERSSTPIEDPFILGAFSTYAFLPAVLAERDEEGPAAFDVLAFGGPPGQSEDDSGRPARMIVVERPPITIRSGTLVLETDAFTIRSAFGNGTLLARDTEFLAFLAGDADDALAVYRADYFPDGFEILGEPDLPASILGRDG